jgi:hypothetical protein
VGCDTCIRMMTNAYRIIMENVMGGRHLEDLVINDMIILKWNTEQ